MKYRFLLFSVSVALCFFGTVFTLIRVFYYCATPTIQEYIFPLLLGSGFGVGFGLWRIQTKTYKEKLEKMMEDLRITNKQLHIKNEGLIAANKKLIETQQRLRQAQKMELVGNMASGVAHDLNNVLCCLVGFPDLLLQEIQKDDPIRNSILTLKKSGQKAAAIAQDLLILSRGGYVTKFSLNLNGIIKEYLASPVFDSLMKFHSSIQLRTNFEADLYRIIGSPIHLAKMVMNLVSNAAEAHKDEGEITIATKNVSIEKSKTLYSDTIPKGHYAVLEISDSGQGLSEEDRERIFEPFYSKKTLGKSGTGLGMSVVWWTLKDHNAYIDVQSNEGSGTTFRLYFPMTTKELVEKESLSFDDDYTGNGESILIVDDVREQRELVTEILEKLGYRVNSVASGEEAVVYLKQNSANLILLDMFMEPGIDGLETYQRILKIKDQQKAIIMSGFSETDRMKKAIELGVGRYLKKPYSMEEMGRAVKMELAA